jgi:predicted Zn-dependent peptidase
LILSELRRVKDKLVSTDEFNRAKEFYLGQLMLALEDTLDQMLWIGEYMVTMDKIYTLSDIVKEIKKIEREDIRKAAQTIFKEKDLNLALIGPLKESQEEIYNRLRLD